MSFFISDAMAEGTAAAQGGGWESIIPLVLLFVVFVSFLKYSLKIFSVLQFLF